MNKQPRTRLEQLTSQRRLSVPAFQREFSVRAEKKLGKRLEVSLSQAKRWLGVFPGFPVESRSLFSRRGFRSLSRSCWARLAFSIDPSMKRSSL